MNQIQQKRKTICQSCPSFRARRCLELRKLKGCSACSEPWRSIRISCPLNKWDERDTKTLVAQANARMQLDPQAINVIKRLAHGRILELGTGGLKGTHACLTNATHLITVDHISFFTATAHQLFADDPRVTALHCRLKDYTYNLPPDLGTFDTILIDGPIGTQARYATLKHTIPMLNPGGIIIVDDANRDESTIDTWAKYYDMAVEYIDTLKGLAILRHEN